MPGRGWRNGFDMIYDITPPITEELRVWPGDTPPSRQVLRHIKDGSSTTLSTLHSTVHLGAHADAPSHYGLGAPGIGERFLDYYLGKCQVISVDVPRATCIEPDAIKVPVEAERVLFRTGTYPDPNSFNEDFAALGPGLVDTLAGKGVKLIGIDTPSVDLFNSKELPAHKAILEHDMAILEGLALQGVPDRVYELIALPLKLVGFDGSPVRAILRTLQQESARGT